MSAVVYIQLSETIDIRSKIAGSRSSPGMIVLGRKAVSQPVSVSVDRRFCRQRHSPINGLPHISRNVQIIAFHSIWYAEREWTVRNIFFDILCTRTWHLRSRMRSFKRNIRSDNSSRHLPVIRSRCQLSPCLFVCLTEALTPLSAKPY